MNHYYRITKKDTTTLTHQELMEFKEAKQNYYVLKKFNWLLFKNDNSITDPNMEKRYNRVLERYCNYYDILDYILRLDIDLEYAYNLKYEIDCLYKIKDISKAKERLEELIVDLRSASVKELVPIANTLTRWKYEILNSFQVIDTRINKKTGEVYQIRMNTSVVENRNKMIKLLKHSSNGYLNFERFRTRILYTINKDTTYHMYPQIGKEKNKWKQRTIS